MAEQLFQRIHGKRSPAGPLGTELVIRVVRARSSRAEDSSRGIELMEID